MRALTALPSQIVESPHAIPLLSGSAANPLLHESAHFVADRYGLMLDDSLPRMSDDCRRIAVGLACEGYANVVELFATRHVRSRVSGVFLCMNSYLRDDEVQRDENAQTGGPDRPSARLYSMWPTFLFKERRRFLSCSPHVARLIARSAPFLPIDEKTEVQRLAGRLTCIDRNFTEMTTPNYLAIFHGRNAARHALLTLRKSTHLHEPYLLACFGRAAALTFQ
ncbi:hypothetical protein [Paraburkholderia sp. BL23I1N1]|uniref:hypothetical protein n=1 Tax=Paraburkholderia sp. BL23I1N1 TaxID=1938802 RepID=UPI0011C36977|nr:hypothetical protein [Paraburkholderia sp. BL23I1N1]